MTNKKSIVPITMGIALSMTGIFSLQAFSLPQGRQAVTPKTSAPPNQQNPSPDVRNKNVTLDKAFCQQGDEVVDKNDNIISFIKLNGSLTPLKELSPIHIKDYIVVLRESKKDGSYHKKLLDHLKISYAQNTSLKDTFGYLEVNFEVSCRTQEEIAEIMLNRAVLPSGRPAIVPSAGE